MGNIKVFESKQKDKNGNPTTSVHIFGSLLPQQKLKAVKNNKVKVVKIKNK